MGKTKNGEKSEEKIDLNAASSIVPDGGWGWFISLAAFVVQFIILGLQNNLGLFHLEHLKEFKQSKFNTGRLVCFVVRSKSLALVRIN